MLEDRTTPADIEKDSQTKESTKKDPKKNKPNKVHVRDPTTNMKVPVQMDPGPFSLPALKNKVANIVHKPADKIQLVDEDTGKPVDPNKAHLPEPP